MSITQSARNTPNFFYSDAARRPRSRAAMSGCSAWRSPQMSVNESMRFYHEKSTMSIAASLTDCSCPPCGEMGRSEAEAVANHNGFWLS